VKKLRLGRRGGKKRNENLTLERRREIGRKAALARWTKKKKLKADRVLILCLLKLRLK